MHFSAQHSAALAVALLSTHAVASGVKAAPIHHKVGVANIPHDGVSKTSVGEFGSAFHTTRDLTADNEKREPLPEPRKGKKASSGNNHSPSRRPSLTNIADKVSTGSDIVSGLGNMYSTVQGATEGNVKREPEPMPEPRKGKKSSGEHHGPSRRPSLTNIADKVSTGSDIVSGLGNMYSTVQGATEGNVKREPEPKIKLGSLVHIGEEAVHGLGSLFSHHSSEDQQQQQQQ